MAQVIQIRRGVAAEWTAKNPVLAEGEMGTELDTHKWKIGDGHTAWTVLPYSPQGIQGVPGPAGPVGPQGPTGLQGPKGDPSTVPGPPGPQGSQGPKGNTGADSTVPGPTGPKGDKGDKGDTGADSTVPGPKGDKGDTGAQGPQGDTGPKGDTGDPGGPQGPAGPAGPAGAPGPTGPAGVDGVDGTPGAPGATGPAGPPGPQGGVLTVIQAASGSSTASPNQCVIVNVSSVNITLPSGVPDGSIVETICQSQAANILAAAGNLWVYQSGHYVSATTFTQYYGTSCRWIYQASQGVWWQASQTYSSVNADGSSPIDVGGYAPNPTILSKWKPIAVGNPNYPAKSWDFVIDTATGAPIVTMPVTANVTGPVAVVAANNLAVNVCPNTGQTILRKNVSYGTAGFTLGAGGAIELWFVASTSRWYPMSDTGT